MPPASTIDGSGSEKPSLLLRYNPPMRPILDLLLAAALSGLAAAGACVAGLQFFARPAIGWIGMAACALIGLLFLWRRHRVAAANMVLGVVFIAVLYPKVEGLESYMREGAMKGLLGSMHQQVRESWLKTGGFPQTLALKPNEAVRIPEHGARREIEIAEFAAESPAHSSGTYVVFSGDARDAQPFFASSDGHLVYRVMDAQWNELSSGTVNVSIPAGFQPDTGALTYSPKLGFFFINCTHKTHQRGDPWWVY